MATQEEFYLTVAWLTIDYVFMPLPQCFWSLQRETNSA